MKSQPKPDPRQLNLALLEPSPAVLPADKNDELVSALVELLLDAAGRHHPKAQPERGHHESETDR
jgi:hypothetical protein